jgi:hypothetical protein
VRPLSTSKRRVRSRWTRLVVPFLVLLALLCLVMARRNYGIQGAYFDADATAPARVAGSSGGGLSTEGVAWLIAAVVSLAGAVAVALRHRRL